MFFLLLNAGVYLFNQLIDIATSPIVAAELRTKIKTTRLVNFPCRIVRKGDLCRRLEFGILIAISQPVGGFVYRIRIEIVVDMDAIDIVSTYHV